MTLQPLPKAVDRGKPDASADAAYTYQHPTVAAFQEKGQGPRVRYRMRNSQLGKFNLASPPSIT